MRQPKRCKGTKRPATSLQPAVAVLLHNLQRHAPCLRRLSLEPRLVRETGHASPFRFPSQPQGSSHKVPAPRAPPAQEPAPNVLRSLTGHVQAALRERKRITWRPEIVEILLAHLTSLPPGSTMKARRAIEKLGLAHIPDPDDRLYNAVTMKLMRLRVSIAHGFNPMEGRRLPQVPTGTYDFRAWLRRAFMALPNRTGTTIQVAAVLEADPDIEPKLDRRLCPTDHNTQMWLRGLRRAVNRYPEFVSTGQRQGHSMLFRYDEEVARQQDEAGGKPPKVPKHRAP
ncbi:hypothetical protein Agub_g6068 [Astrephomene gubernaculifera]|uniref:Uncharacterized protein n=1 Tax=Astrephomene gubernaculifera TaxID=47775 RepID=A0AAD3DMS9_9CHLO|nr:hypothetical protein Agub_g6068 [Astrephomene gubernaculifera]